MIEITHIKWSGNKIGIALHKLKDGLNEVLITAKNKSGIPYYPEQFIVDKERLIKQYGITTINKNHLQGIWIPINDLLKENNNGKENSSLLHQSK